MTSIRSSWRVATVGIAAGTAAIVALYFDGFAGFVSVWSSTAAYRFLFLVPVVSLYLVAVRLPAIVELTPKPSLLGLAYAAPFAALWLVAQATQLSIAAQVAAIGMLQAVFLTVLGWRICVLLLFPLLLLWLMVPFGDVLTPGLIELTTTLTIAGLNLAGLESVADGNLLVAGGARYAIIQECSGLDFLLGNLLVSLTFANLLFASRGKQIGYVLAGVVVAILANNLRTISVVLITAGGINLAANHEAYGWFVFCFAMLLQMAVGLRFRDSPPAVRPRDDFAWDHDSRGPKGRVPVGPTVAAVCSIVVLAAAAPVWSRLVLAPPADVPLPVVLCVPPAVQPHATTGHATTGNADRGWQPSFPTAGAHVSGAIAGGSRPVDFFVAYYWRQGPASKMLGWANRLYDGADWRYSASGADVALVDGIPVAVATQRLVGANGQRRLVWYWYWVDGRFVDRPWRVTLQQARAVLVGGDPRAATIALATDETGESTRVNLQSALDQVPAITTMLKAATRGDAPGRACT